MGDRAEGVGGVVKYPWVLEGDGPDSSPHGGNIPSVGNPADRRGYVNLVPVR